MRRHTFADSVAEIEAVSASRAEWETSCVYCGGVGDEHDSIGVRASQDWRVLIPCPKPEMDRLAARIARLEAITR